MFNLILLKIHVHVHVHNTANSIQLLCNVSITITFHEYHRSPCDDWVEMSSDEEVNDKDKLKVVVTPRLVTPSSSKSIEQGPKLESESVADAPNGAISKWRLQPRRLGSDEESDAETVTTPKTRKRVVSDSDDGDTTGTGDSSSIASTSSGVPVKKRRTIEKSKEDSVPLPDPFPLPKHHSVEVEMAIKEKKFSNVARQAFVGKVAAAMLFYNRYPTSEDYANVGRTVIQKYLCLKSPIGTPAVSYLYVHYIYRRIQAGMPILNGTWSFT